MNRSPVDALHSPAAILRFVLTTAIGLSLDLWVKSLAVTHLKFGDPINFIPGWLRFEYTENRGAVFGIAQGQWWVFLVVSAIALVFLTYLFSTSGRRSFYQIILGLLLAGVLGNMYDRVVFGYVRDMIHALPGWQWPAWMLHALPFLPAEVFPWIFNVADSMLCVGVGLMLIYSLFQPTPRPAPASKTEPADA